PCTSSVESPETAAARCSDTHVLAVPGTPSSSSARSVASVATATSIRRRLPTYFGVITVPSAAAPPSRYVVTAHGDSRQPGGRGRSSPAASAASSEWYSPAACGRRHAALIPGSAVTVTILELAAHVMPKSQHVQRAADRGRRVGPGTAQGTRRA